MAIAEIAKSVPAPHKWIYIHKLFIDFIFNPCIAYY